MKNVWMILYLLCLMAVPHVASAQDVIVKKDGNTVVCRVMRVDKSEVIYKRWTELQGNNYVMNLTDISTINFENGEKRSFNESGNTPLVQLPNTNQGYVDDATLLRMTQSKDNFKKAKRIKSAGRIGGTSLLDVGTGALIAYFSIFYDSLEEHAPYAFAGGAALISGGAWLYFSNRKAKHLMEKESLYSIQSAPIMQNEFRLKNGSSLSAGLNAISDRTNRCPIPGLGLMYNF